MTTLKTRRNTVLESHSKTARICEEAGFSDWRRSVAQQRAVEVFFYALPDQITAITGSIFTVDDLLKEMKVIQFYDDYTYQHSVEVMAISLFLAKKEARRRRREKLYSERKDDLSAGSVATRLSNAFLRKIA